MDKLWGRCRWAAAPLLIWIALAGSSDAQAPATLGAYVGRVTKADAFSGVVLVTHREKRLLANAYGLANAEHGVLNTLQTKFRIGSMTKPFTATAILMLQEQGKLHVSDPLTKHFADVPKAWQSITLSQLLSHTSGIVHTFEAAGARDALFARMAAWHLTKRTSPPSFEELAKIYGEQRLIAPAGEEYHYSGPGYFLLARVIEKVSGEPYEKFLRSRMFEPLGMKDTGSDRPDQIITNRAAGYVRTDRELRNAPPEYTPFRSGGGDLYSTAEDLWRWDVALRAGRLVSAESQDMMFTPVRSSYGYGWEIQGERNARIVKHTGAIAGFHSVILRDLRSGVCVIVLNNTEAASVGRIAEELRRIAEGALPGRE